MKGVWNNLKEVKLALKNIPKQEFKGGEQRIQYTRNHLRNIHATMKQPRVYHHIVEEEKNCKTELVKW